VMSILEPHHFTLPYVKSLKEAMAVPLDPYLVSKLAYLNEIPSARRLLLD